MPLILKTKNIFFLFKIHFLVFETRYMFLFKNKFGFFNIRNSLFYMRKFIIISIINYLILEIGYFILENGLLILENKFLIWKWISNIRNEFLILEKTVFSNIQNFCYNIRNYI